MSFEKMHYRLTKMEATDIRKELATRIQQLVEAEATLDHCLKLKLEPKDEMIIKALRDAAMADRLELREFE